MIRLGLQTRKHVGKMQHQSKVLKPLCIASQPLHCTKTMPLNVKNHAPGKVVRLHIIVLSPCLFAVSPNASGRSEGAFSRGLVFAFGPTSPLKPTAEELANPWCKRIGSHLFNVHHLFGCQAVKALCTQSLKPGVQLQNLLSREGRPAIPQNRIDISWNNSMPPWTSWHSGRYLQLEGILLAQDRVDRWFVRSGKDSIINTCWSTVKTRRCEQATDSIASRFAERWLPHAFLGGAVFL
jgi:hypothetical protein